MPPQRSVATTDSPQANLANKRIRSCFASVRSRCDTHDTMGRVFSLEQVHHQADHIPTPNDFRAAIHLFEQASHEEIEQGTISGTVIFGSVAIGAYNVQSDFDCMIVPFDHSQASQAARQRIKSGSNPSGRLDVSDVFHSRERLASGAHEIDRFFGLHLTGPSRLVFGEDPAEYMSYPEYGAETHLLSYIRHKKRSILGDGEHYYKRLQRTLELPLAVGRKALHAMQELRGKSRQLSWRYGKQGLDDSSSPGAI